MNIIIDDRIDVLLNCLHFILSNILHTVAKVASTESDTVTEKRGNVEINKSPQAGIEPGASRFKIHYSTE